ncbi:MAG: protein-L-isoaspartate(D-aspartate) O-methyltransferase [Candidatus Edwardsbacteria bacterium]
MKKPKIFLFNNHGFNGLKSVKICVHPASFLKRCLGNEEERCGVNLWLLILFIAFLFSCKTAEVKLNFTKARQQMVKHQIEAGGIKDKRVLEAMNKTPRHLFVPAEVRSEAYEDYPLPIGEGQTISQPYIVALMTEVLKLKGNEKVLEIGTGSGYQAAILAELSKEVYTIEILKPLADRAESTLVALGYKNVKVKCGDGYLGWEEFAPYDAIIITCAPPKIPKPLIEQLKEGGRIVVPLGEEGQVQILTLIEKIKGEIKKTPIAEVLFVPMTGEGVKKF